MSSNDSQEQQMAVIAGNILTGVVAGLIENGVPASMAFRFAAIALIENASGPEVFEALGVSRRTRYRYHAEIRRYFAGKPELLANPPADLAQLFENPTTPKEKK